MAIVKDAVFETCKCCGWRKRISEEVRGCDVCQKVFGDPDTPLLHFTVFRHDNTTEQVDCCSWLCVLKALKTVKSDYFVSLPFLHFDDAPEGTRAQDFFAAIERIRND